MELFIGPPIDTLPVLSRFLVGMASEADVKGDSIIVPRISTNWKAFFDEDEEGFWLDTGNLSKQDKAASKSIAGSIDTWLT